MTECSMVVDKYVARAEVLGRSRITWGGDGIITRIAPTSDPSDGYMARAGFIDSHFHGYGGVDTAWEVPSPEKWRKLDEGLLARGITGYLPGTLFSSPNVISEIADGILSASVEGLLGIYVEGTFVNPDARGGLPIEEIRPADIGLCAEMLDAAKGLARIVLVSPEIDGACELIAFLRENDVIPAIGHSRADYAQAKRAIDAGALRATHWPNVMKWGDHHDPAIGVAVLGDDRVYVEVIGDNMHVAAPLIDMAARCKGDKLVMVSDTVAVAGAVDDPEIMKACGLEMREGRLFMAGTDTHSGGFVPLDECCGRQLSLQSLPMAYLTSACSANVAESLARPDLGEIAVGKRADIAVMDENGSVSKVYRKGRLCSK